MARQSETNKRLEEIERLLASLDKTLALNTAHLDEHIRRTEILEDQIQPVTKHVEQMRGAGKLLAILALIAGTIHYLT
jgi:hypothetical protein